MEYYVDLRLFMLYFIKDILIFCLLGEILKSLCDSDTKVAAYIAQGS